MAQQEWFVYAHILKADGCRYIGQTNNLNARWKPSAYKNCVKFYNAIALYGWDAFEHTVLEENLTLEQANQREEYYISLCNSAIKHIKEFGDYDWFIDDHEEVHLPWK